MYDALVVGGRCAGAATAMLLARQGHKVLIVDQAKLPSDLRLSTHLIWHAGVDLLKKWDLLDEVLASNCPPQTHFALDMGELVLRGQPPGSQAGMALAPRRHVLDKILLDAAVKAGAELRQGVTFEDVEKDGDRVIGVRGRIQDGSASFSAHARIVIGADGAYSRVARTVGAEAYNVFPKEAGAYNTYSYFSGVPLTETVFYGRPERMVYAWPTNDGLTLVGIMQPGSAPRPARADVEQAFFDELDAMTPDLAARLHAGRREDDWLSAGTGAFCHQAAGPGWCLVGDAGLTMDPITAAGITNAFRDADTLSTLIHQGLAGGTREAMDQALSSYQTQRDAASLPLMHFTQDMARLAPPTEDVIKLVMALAQNQAQTDRYFGLFGQTVTPTDFFSPENMAQIFGASAPTA